MDRANKDLSTGDQLGPVLVITIQEFQEFILGILHKHF